MTKLRILVGFSGGVDSAVTAMLLREQGHNVAGLMMSVGTGTTGCGAGSDPGAAQRVAERIGIDLHVVDVSREYRARVLEYFRDEYLSGRTPNPCVQCNPTVKFGALLVLARESGLAFDRFATGHYARLIPDPATGGNLLYRGADPGKDQSYFLYRLSHGQRAVAMFPLGEARKEQVREWARQRGLEVHDKPDSQDFHADYAELLGRDDREGDIVELSGRIVGRHNGFWRFTPGQRRGLGVAHPAPLYVDHVDPAANRVVVGTREETLKNGCVADDLRFAVDPPRPGETLTGRMRSAQALHEMRVGEGAAPGELLIHFAKPQHGVAPGQSLVLYRGDLVVGGGIIRSAL